MERTIGAVPAVPALRAAAAMRAAVPKATITSGCKRARSANMAGMRSNTPLA
jgi:hypothetical protein